MCVESYLHSCSKEVQLVVKARLARGPMFKAFMNPIVLCWPFSDKVFDVFIEACGIGFHIICWKIGKWFTSIAGISFAIWV
jgi:hypothetical protein